MDVSARRATLEQLHAEIKACERCDLCKTRTQAVPGEGPVTAQIMLVGEGPGQREDQLGRPFVGASGQWLTELLGLAGLKREEVYITNVVKSRPPGRLESRISKPTLAHSVNPPTSWYCISARSAKL